MSNESRPEKISRENWLHFAIITLLIAIIYIPSLDVPFIFDDRPNIVLNLSVHAEKPAQLLKAFNSNVSGTRPLAMLSFAANHLLSGLDVFGFHAFNIGIHILNTLLLYLILLIIPSQSGQSSDTSIKAKLAFWAAVLWAANPVQTQAVTYIVQRMTSMATFFYMAGIYVFLLWRRGSCKTSCFSPLISICFMAGMACKEIVITLPATLFLIDFIFYPEKYRRNLLTLAFITTLSFLLGLYYLHGNLPDWTATYPNRNFSPLERVMTQWRVIWHYLALFFFPLPERLHLTYNISVSKSLLTPITTLVSLLFLLTTVTAAGFFRRSHKTLSFSILFFFFASFPEASFVNLELAFIHRIYLPSLFLGWAILSNLPPQFLNKGTLFFLLITALISFWTIERNNEWLDRETFWDSNITRGAETARAKNNLATSLIDRGDFTKALNIIEAGLTIVERDEDRKLLLYNQACTLFYLERYEESLVSFKHVAQEFGAFMNTYLFIGKIYIHQDKAEKALLLAAELKKITGIEYQGELLIVENYYTIKEFQKAEVRIRDIIRNDQSGVVFIEQRLQLELAKILMAQKKYEEAFSIFTHISKRFPDNYSVWKMIYHMLESAGENERAEKVWLFLQAKGIEIEKKGPGQ